MNNYSKHTSFFILAVVLVVLFYEFVRLPSYNMLMIVQGKTINRVSPGEMLPIAVNLTNFGSMRRTDVTVMYALLDKSGAQISSASETVAVDTTAQFIKQFPIDITTRPGIYRMQTSIDYQYQERPAISEFTVTVERKFFGLYQGDFIVYGAAAFILSLGTFYAGTYFMRRMSVPALRHDYSKHTRAERVYYEMLSEVIAQMRLHVGDEAFDIAASIPHLAINKDTGEVLSIDDDPSKLMTLLLYKYELATKTQNKLSFQDNKEYRRALEPVLKNIDMVRKYF